MRVIGAVKSLFGAVADGLERLIEPEEKLWPDMTLINNFAYIAHTGTDPEYHALRMLANEMLTRVKENPNGHPLLNQYTDAMSNMSKFDGETIIAATKEITGPVYSKLYNLQEYHPNILARALS